MNKQAASARLPVRNYAADVSEASSGIARVMPTCVGFRYAVLIEPTLAVV